METMILASWRRVWRQGFGPLLTEAELRLILGALHADDPRLLQGCTTKPPPLQCVQDWPLEEGCLFAFSTLATGGTVADAEERFARLCYEADQALGEPAGCRHFLNWYDDAPRAEMISALIPEVEQTLAAKLESARKGV